MKNKLALITMDSETKRELCCQLTNLLGDRLTLECYSLEDVTKQHIDAQVVLVSNYYLLPEIKEKFTFECYTRILNARRSIGKQGIRVLLSIPRGKRCVLFVNHRSLSCHMINSIKQLGITHIEIIPEEGEGYDFSDIDYIITGGKGDFQKYLHARSVDIGILRLDITTIIEVLIALDLIDEMGSIVSAKYEREIIELSQEVSVALDESTKMSKVLEVVVNSDADAVVMVDEVGKIIVSNAAAEKLFSRPQDRLIGQVFHTPNGFPWNWTQLHKVNDSVLYFKSFKLVVNTNPVETPSGRVGTVLTFRDVTEIQRLEEMVRKDRSLKGLEARFSFENIVGESERVKSAINIGCKLATADAAILIYGESGVGKELFAQAIHNASGRKTGPFVGVNFSAVSESLMESELFGYEEGAFTGARKGGRPGLFEMAYGGTIFLDEIGDASPALQSRLLRVLQEKQVMRVGATKISPIDVRVIAATNKSLTDLVQKGLFREDLYYRLNVLPLDIPPLRERSGDGLLLLRHFFNKKGFYNDITPEAWRILASYTWPGNIRELINVAEYICCTIGPKEIVGVEKLPRNIVECYYNIYTSNTSLPTERSRNKDCVLRNLPDDKRYKESILVLRAIDSILRSKKSIGRRSLSDAIVGMPESRIRCCLRILSDMGYVKIETGRKGTSISEAGLNLLNKLSKA